jgi:hypothetical protein
VALFIRHRRQRLFFLASILNGMGMLAGAVPRVLGWDAPLVTAAQWFAVGTLVASFVVLVAYLRIHARRT